MFSIFKKRQESVAKLSRKEQSEQVLKAHNIKINYNLPHIEADEEVSIRDGAEIAQRLVLLCVTNLVAFDNITGAKALEFLEENNILQYITPDEKTFLENPTPEKRSQESWKCECIWVLAWALNLVDDLEFPDHLCDLNKIAEEDYPISNSNDPNNYINRNFTIRSKSEILDAADLYYRMDWAVVDARLNGLSVEPLNPGVVYERHYALNWLINYMDQDWDEVSCDT